MKKTMRSAPATATKQKKGGNGKKWAAGILVLLVLGAAGNKNKEQEPQETPQTALAATEHTGAEAVVLSLQESTEAPTGQGTESPTEEATEVPTEKATEAPTEAPTEKPTEPPTEAPTEKPTDPPTEAPTEEPTQWRGVVMDYKVNLNTGVFHRPNSGCLNNSYNVKVIRGGSMDLEDMGYTRCGRCLR